MSNSVEIHHEGKLLLELVENDGTFAIRRKCTNGWVDYTISAKKFNAIIEDARANGCEVFDYRTFN